MAQLSRRGLLGATATAAVGLLGVAACEGEPAAPPPFDPRDWASVRAQFALDPAVAHLSTFVFAPHPAGVRAAIEKHRDGFDRDPIGYLHEHEAVAEGRVAGAVMEYLGTGIDRVALTDSTTLGLGLLYAGLRLGPGDEVLTTKHDFYATHDALRLRTERDGVAVRRGRALRRPGHRVRRRDRRQAGRGGRAADEGGRGDLGALQHRGPAADQGHRRRPGRP